MRCPTTPGKAGGCKRVHSRRAFDRDCDHRRTRGAPLAGGSGEPGGGQSEFLRKQSPPNGPGGSATRDREGLLSERLGVEGIPGRGLFGLVALSLERDRGADALSGKY